MKLLACQINDLNPSSSRSAFLQLVDNLICRGILYFYVLLLCILLVLITDLVPFSSVGRQDARYLAARKLSPRIQARPVLSYHLLMIFLTSKIHLNGEVLPTGSMLLLLILLYYLITTTCLQTVALCLLMISLNGLLIVIVSNEYFNLSCIFSGNSPGIPWER